MTGEWNVQCPLFQLRKKRKKSNRCWSISLFLSIFCLISPTSTTPLPPFPLSTSVSIHSHVTHNQFDKAQMHLYSISPNLNWLWHFVCVDIEHMLNVFAVRSFNYSRETFIEHIENLLFFLVVIRVGYCWFVQMSPECIDTISLKRRTM